jgi:hypothetical protein
VFLRVPAPFAVKQEEAIRMSRTELAVETLDPVAGGRQNRRIAGHVARIGVHEIAENREVDARIEFAEREHFDVLQERRDRRGARQHRRHDDHRAGFVWNPIREVESRQTARRNRPCDDALRQGDGDVGRRDEKQEQQTEQQADRCALVPRVRRDARQQSSRDDRDRSQVEERRMVEHETHDTALEPGPMRDVELEAAPSAIDQVVPDVGRAIGGRATRGRLARALDGSQRHLHLRLSARRRELFDGLPLSIAAEKVHPAVRA